jgi:hypothetical protein
VDFLQQATGLSQPAACRQFIELATGCRPVHKVRPRVEARLVVLISLPALSNGTLRDWMALSLARGVSHEAVELAVHRGLLWFGYFRHQPAWFLTDSSRRVIQARRMDNMRWWRSGPKALTISGGQGSWPVGASEAGPFSSVLLMEGGPDLLAAFHFLILADRVSTVTAVSMLGAANQIHPDALGLLSGKSVRIIPHRDEPDEKGRRAGIDAARRWQNQLQSVGANAKIINIGDFMPQTEYLKDLNDASRLPIMLQAALATRLAGLPSESSPGLG